MDAWYLLCWVALRTASKIPNNVFDIRIFLLVQNIFQNRRIFVCLFRWVSLIRILVCLFRWVNASLSMCVFIRKHAYVHVFLCLCVEEFVHSMKYLYIRMISLRTCTQKYVERLTSNGNKNLATVAFYAKILDYFPENSSNIFLWKKWKKKEGKLAS